MPSVSWEGEIAKVRASTCLVSVRKRKLRGMRKEGKPTRDVDEKRKIRFVAS